MSKKSAPMKAGKAPAKAPKQADPDHDGDPDAAHHEQAISGAKLLNAIAHAHLQHLASKGNKKPSDEGAPPSDGPMDGSAA